jgi:hypothetical protein
MSFPRMRESMTFNEMDPRVRGDDTTFVIHGIDENAVISAQVGIHLESELALASHC